MKTIGLVGGTSWVSTLDYYRLINTGINERLGGNQAARLLLYSVNYGDIVAHTHAGNWEMVAEIIGSAAQILQDAGADCMLLGANTMHHIAPQVQDRLRIPLLHIADVVAEGIKKQGLKTVALLGTRYTMTFHFYRERLAVHGIDTIIPDAEGINWVNESIYNELGKNIFRNETKQGYLTLMQKLHNEGAEGVILGCTEIPLLINQKDTDIPVFDTTAIHAGAAVDFALTG